MIPDLIAAAALFAASWLLPTSQRVTHRLELLTPAQVDSEAARIVGATIAALQDPLGVRINGQLIHRQTDQIGPYTADVTVTLHAPIGTRT